MSSVPVKISPAPSSPEDWEYNEATGLYHNRLTNAVAEEPDTDVPAVGTISASAEEEDGFTVSEQQYRAGVRLAISGRSGLVKRCPVCKRRRLLIVPKDGATFLTCAGKLATHDVFSEEGEAGSDEDACDFERKVP